MLKLHPELSDCLSLPKSDGTPGDAGHPVNLNSVRRGVTSEGKPDAKEEKQQDGGEQSVEQRRYSLVQEGAMKLKKKLTRDWSDMTTREDAAIGKQAQKAQMSGKKSTWMLGPWSEGDPPSSSHNSFQNPFLPTDKLRGESTPIPPITTQEIPIGEQ